MAVVFEHQKMKAKLLALFYLISLTSIFQIAPILAQDPFSDYNTDISNYYLTLASAAYCPTASVMTFNCSECDSAQFTPIGTFWNGTTTEFGFVGISNRTKEVVVSFRGTVETDVTDWIYDINFPLRTPWPTNPEVDSDGAEVHEGFLADYNSLQGQIIAYLTPLVKRFPDWPIRVVGHSLGGALSVLCAVDLKLNVFPNSIIKTWTFGQPRVGNPGFATLYSALITETYRVTHWRDIVPHLPPELFGFSHSPVEFWYNLPNTEYTVCDARKSRNCSDQLLFPDSIYDHLSYFNRSQGTCGGDIGIYNRTELWLPQWNSAALDILELPLDKLEDIWGMPYDQ